MRKFSFRRKMWVLVGVLAVLVGTVPAAIAGNANTGVIPPQSRGYGNTYGEWSAAFWQWLFSIPVNQNPAFDETGGNALVGQTGKVWFLPGVFNASGQASREITIPAGISLFVPVVNVECSNVELPPFFGGTDEELKECAMQYLFTGLEAELDGRPIDFTTVNYQSVSPPFDFELPPMDLQGGNILGVDADLGRAVSNGYYLFLTPLPVGDHTLHYKGTLSNFDFTLEIHYVIHVVPAK